MNNLDDYLEMLYQVSGKSDKEREEGLKLQVRSCRVDVLSRFAFLLKTKYSGYIFLHSCCSHHPLSITYHHSFLITVLRSLFLTLSISLYFYLHLSPHHSLTRFPRNAARA